MKKVLYLFTILLFLNTYAFDNSKWQLDDENNVYFQNSVQYCTKSNEGNNLSIYVPKNYMKCKKQFCKITKKNLPLVLSLNSDNFKNYTDNGIIYTNFESENEDLLYLTTNLKAIVQFLNKYTKKVFIKGDTPAAITGVSIKSKQFSSYLNEIGAIKTKEKIYGVMVYSPVLNPESENECYEWCYGNLRKKLDKKQQQLSNNLARDYAFYVNKFRFKNDKKELLTISRLPDGTYKGGNYTQYVTPLIPPVIKKRKKIYLNDIQAFKADKNSKMLSPLSYFVLPYNSKFVKRWMVNLENKTLNETNFYLALKNNKKIKQVIPVCEGEDVEKSFINWILSCKK